MKSETIKIIPIPTFSESRGNLSVLDFADVIPFPVKRAFYIYGVSPTEKRGDHATCSPEFIVCLSGHCLLTAHNGCKSTQINLCNPKEGYYLPSKTWRILSNFSPDCILLCFSDRPYDKKDYIHDFNSFLQSTQHNN